MSITTPFGEHRAKEHRPHFSGERYVFAYPNGFGASVVRFQYSYGGSVGLWELAVLDAEGHLSYETPITNDVLGYLSEEDVAAVLDRIANLAANPLPPNVNGGRA